MHNFITSCIGSFGNYWFTEFCRSSKCWHISLYNLKNSFLPMPLPISPEKMLSIRKLMVADPSFQKFLFCLKVEFSHWQQILSVVSLEVIGSLCSFLRKDLPNTQIWITTAGLPFVLSKWSMKKRYSSFAIQILKFKLFCKYFSLR